jgi:hypothetical protein
MTFYLWLYDLMTINSLDGQVVSAYTTFLHINGADYEFDIKRKWLGKDR